LQGYSGRHAGRLSTLERQKEMEVSVSTLVGQVSAVLTSTAANTLAVEDLKTLLTKYLQKMNSAGDCSPSVSISAKETPVPRLYKWPRVLPPLSLVCHPSLAPKESYLLNLPNKHPERKQAE
jgi:hypothetical protein